MRASGSIAKLKLAASSDTRRLAAPSSRTIPAVRRLAREDDVLGDGHDGDEHEVLVHHPDPALDRLLRRVDRQGLAVDHHVALVLRVQAVEDAHQGGLAGAVLPEERVHLAPAQVEVDVVVREHARELLRDPAQLEDDGAVACGRDLWPSAAIRDRERVRRAGRPARPTVVAARLGRT